MKMVDSPQNYGHQILSRENTANRRKSVMTNEKKFALVMNNDENTQQVERDNKYRVTTTYSTKQERTNTTSHYPIRKHRSSG